MIIIIIQSKYEKKKYIKIIITEEIMGNSNAWDKVIVFSKSPNGGFDESVWEQYPPYATTDVAIATRTPV